MLGCPADRQRDRLQAYDLYEKLKSLKRRSFEKLL